MSAAPTWVIHNGKIMGGSGGDPCQAGVNVIDHDRLRLCPLGIVHDLPAARKRLVQRTRGFDAIVLSGEIVYRDDVATGSLPGRLVRGMRAAPAVVQCPEHAP